MRLIKRNILGTLLEVKEGNAIKQGLLYIPIKSDTLRTVKVRVDEVDPQIEDIKKGDVLHIHKNVGHFLTDTQFIFNKGHIIYGD